MLLSGAGHVERVPLPILFEIRKGIHYIDIMKKWEKMILESKTPEEYVEHSLRSKLLPAEKAKLARQWMESSGFTKADILYARNRNPFWKKKKMEGAEERTRRRLDMHDYSRGKNGAVDEREDPGIP